MVSIESTLSIQYRIIQVVLDRIDVQQTKCLVFGKSCSAGKLRQRLAVEGLVAKQPAHALAFAQPLIR